MAPRKRRKTKETEEELIFNENLNEAFYKYRQDEVEVEIDDTSREDVGMFEDEEAEPKILIENLERVCEEVKIVWDEAVLAILDQEQKNSKLVPFETVKLIIETLKVIYSINNNCIICIRLLRSREKTLSTCSKHLAIQNPI